MSAKGYVVRGTKGTRRVYAYGPGMGFGDACEEIPAHEFERLDAAAGARDHMVRLGCEAAIFRVHPDGREERLPSYEEALGEIVRIDATLATTRRDEHRRADDTVADRVDSLAAALAVADADMYRVREVLGCKVEEETHAVAERLLTEIERCVDALKGATK